MPLDGAARRLFAVARSHDSILSACRAIGRRGSYLAPLLASGAPPAARAGGEPRAVAYEAREQAREVAAAEEDLALEKAITDAAVEYPAYDQIQIANALHRAGFVATPAQVHGTLSRNRLASRRARVDELIRRSARYGVYLTVEQVVAVLDAVADADASGLHVDAEGGFGGCGFQDTFDVGEVARVGRLYLHTFVDPVGGLAFAKLHAERSARAAVDLLEEMVLPHYARSNRSLRCVVTDRGTEFCGFVGEHVYEAFVFEAGLGHRWLRARNAQHNPVSAHLHRRIFDDLLCSVLLDEQLTSRYDLQRCVDAWIAAHNGASRARI